MIKSGRSRVKNAKNSLYGDNDIFVMKIYVGADGERVFLTYAGWVCACRKISSAEEDAKSLFADLLRYFLFQILLFIAKCDIISASHENFIFFHKEYIGKDAFSI